MSNGQQQQSTASTWTEPPWSGWIETTGDALLILEAARRGLIPRVTRRLVDSERKMITSGSVFVFDEDESGIKRWTDGFFWSPSRILGNFLLYRETEKRGAGHSRSVKGDQELNSNEGTASFSADVVRSESQSLSRPKTDSSNLGVDKNRERSLMGSLTNSYKFKPEGLMKKTFSLTIDGVAQHLISYYKVEDVENGRLRSPSSLPELASLDISPQYLDKTHFRNPPKVDFDPDGVPRYRGEAEDIDASPPAPSMLTAPLLSSVAINDGRATENLSAGSKRPKQRFEPYIQSKKRPRSNTKSSQPDSSTTPTADGPVSPAITTNTVTVQPGNGLQAPQHPQPPPMGYPDPNGPTNMGMAAPLPPPGTYPPYPFYHGYPPPHGHIYAPHPPQQPTGYPHHGPPPLLGSVNPATVGPPAPGATSPQIAQQASTGAVPAGTVPVQVQVQYPYPSYSPSGAATAPTTSSTQVHVSDPSQAGNGSGQPVPAPATGSTPPEGQVQHPHTHPPQQLQYAQQQPQYYPYYAPPPHGHPHALPHHAYGPAPGPIPLSYHPHPQWHPHPTYAGYPPPPMQHQHMQMQMHPAVGGYAPGAPPGSGVLQYGGPGVYGSAPPVQQQQQQGQGGVGVGVQTKSEDADEEDA